MKFIGNAEGFFDNEHNIQHPVELEDDSYQILDYVDGEWVKLGSVQYNKKLLRKKKEFRFFLHDEYVGSYFKTDGEEELQYGKLRLESKHLGMSFSIIEGKKKIKADVQCHIGDFQQYITVYDKEVIYPVLMVCLAKRLDLYKSLT